MVQTTNYPPDRQQFDHIPEGFLLSRSLTLLLNPLHAMLMAGLSHQHGAGA